MANTRSSTTYILTTTNGSCIISKTGSASVSMPESLAKELGVDEIKQAISTGADQNPLYTLLLKKLGAPGLSDQIKNFIKDEMKSLREKPIAKNPEYVMILEQIDKCKNPEIERFSMEEMKEIRESQQKNSGIDKVLNEYLSNPNIASVVVRTSNTDLDIRDDDERRFTFK
ncbi:MAG: hypothetical protein ACD_46C00221G0013 [uncultured bacterium]|nr:MAG: hypothetical protein ACD_46C00221G0013 [uncultured bacterium]